MSWQGNKINEVPNPVQMDLNHNDLKSGETRALNIRRDTDVVKYPGISLLDIDQSIIEYLDKKIDPHVEEAGNIIKVPVVYGSPERWKAAKKDGVFRDFNGKIQLPVLMIRRESFAKNESMMSLNRHLTYPVMTKYSEKNKYDKFSIYNSSVKPVNSVYAVTVPDHIKITYKFMVWTELVEQMNSVLEKINFASEDYWGDEKRFRFRVYMGDYSNNIEVVTGKDRMVKTEFTATVMAYLLPSSFEDKKNTMEKLLTPRKMIVTEGAVNTIDTQNIDERRIKASLIDGYVMLDSEKKEMVPPTISMQSDSLGAASIEKIKNSYQNLISNTIISGEESGIWHMAPNNSTDYGEEGWMAYDGNYHYIYVNGEWKRQPITNFNQF
jgi:hypothetical protein